MKSERILAYKMAQQLSEEDIQSLSAAKGTSQSHATSGIPTFNGCFRPPFKPCDSRSETDHYND